MCVIVGAVSKTRHDVTGTAVRMVESVTKEFPHLDRAELSLRDEHFEFSSMDDMKAASRRASSIALGIVYSSTHKSYCLAIGEPQSRIAALIGRIFNQPDVPASLLRLLKMNLDSNGNLYKAFGNFTRSFDGQYALVLRWGDAFLLARDPVGVKPLYLAESDRLVAFSSRCRPLLALGLRTCRNISGSILLSENGTRAYRSDVGATPVKTDDKETAEYLTTLLSRVLAKMIMKEHRVGVLFSGGLDSSVIAKLSKSLGADCTLYCAGTRSSRDLANAKRMSSALDIELVEKEISCEEVAEHLRRVVELIESTDMIRVSTSLPLFFSVVESARRGERVLLHGQGADELYCGYERYENTLAKTGYAAVQNEMLDDVKKLGDIMPQYDKIGTSASVEMLAPFLDVSLLRYSVGIPVQLKLHREGGRVTRKYILRQVASRIGIPVDLLPPKKVAIQFGSGVARIMDTIARKAGFSRRTAKDLGFSLPIQAYLSKIGESTGFPLEHG